METTCCRFPKSPLSPTNHLATAICWRFPKSPLAPDRSGDSRNHQWCLVVDGNVSYHLIHNVRKRCDAMARCYNAFKKSSWADKRQTGGGVAPFHLPTKTAPACAACAKMPWPFSPTASSGPLVSNLPFPLPSCLPGFLPHRDAAARSRAPPLPRGL